MKNKNDLLSCQNKFASKFSTQQSATTLSQMSQIAYLIIIFAFYTPYLKEIIYLS